MDVVPVSGEQALSGEQARSGGKARRRLAQFALLAVVALTIGCDQVSKQLAAEHLQDLPRQSYFGDVLRLEYAENTGAFLSLGANLPPWARMAIFGAGTAIVLAIFAAVALRRRTARVQRIGLALLFAGGVSNLGDRLARGSVIDFLNVGVGGLRTGIFNVADMAILLGVALFVASRPRQEEGRIRSA